MLAAPKRLGSIRVPRVVFGLSPAEFSGGDSPRRMRSPDLPRDRGLSVRSSEMIQ